MRFRIGYVALAVVFAMATGFAGYRLGRNAALGVTKPPIGSANSISRPISTRQTPLVAATYMGGHWSKNFINAFRRENVAADFAKMRADGFNAVLLLVSWGDFQPVFEPCCRYDERAFERLTFLIEQAREAGLDVVLRIGYAWTFQPDAGDVGVRGHRLLNEQSVREAYLKYVERIGEIARQHANVRLTFFSWEDFLLRAIDPQARAEFNRFLSGLPADHPWRAYLDEQRPLPTSNGPDMPVFEAYWDWLLMQDLFRPMAQRLPQLAYEARIDREPLPHVDAAGAKTYSWIGHETTYHPPGADVAILYWAPFWGARNEGEQLDAPQALQLFSALLDDVRQHSGGLPMFIDQFNVIDNTLGFERNATLQPAALPAFMDGALCALRKAGVFGYGYWTTRDYAESPLYNPAFSYSLDGWELSTADHSAARQRLVRRASGDFDVRLRPGDRLSQAIPARRGRLPGVDPRWPATVCISVRGAEPGDVEVSAGGAPVRLKFSGSAAQERVCGAISTVATDSSLALEIRSVSGTPDLTEVMLFDHIQEGGLYSLEGADGSIRPLLRELNHRFAQHAEPNECDAKEPATQAH